MNGPGTRSIKVKLSSRYAVCFPAVCALALSTHASVHTTQCCPTLTVYAKLRAHKVVVYMYWPSSQQHAHFWQGHFQLQLMRETCSFRGCCTTPLWQSPPKTSMHVAPYLAESEYVNCCFLGQAPHCCFLGQAPHLVQSCLCNVFSFTER